MQILLVIILLVINFIGNLSFYHFPLFWNEAILGILPILHWPPHVGSLPSLRCPKSVSEETPSYRKWLATCYHGSLFHQVFAFLLIPPHFFIEDKELRVIVENQASRPAAETPWMRAGRALLVSNSPSLMMRVHLELTETGFNRKSNWGKCLKSHQQQPWGVGLMLAYGINHKGHKRGQTPSKAKRI